MNENQRKLREAAAQILEKRGWCQGEYQDSFGRCCLQGALLKARKDRGLFRTPIPFYEPKAVLWNDTPGRTKEEVIALLRSDATEVPS